MNMRKIEKALRQSKAFGSFKEPKEIKHYKYKRKHSF